ncbi:putative UVR domain, ApaG domain, ApaG domain superfamily, UVR domain superfamily protein [Helianthus debilis subsp. tardiflorus]
MAANSKTYLGLGLSTNNIKSSTTSFPCSKKKKSNHRMMQSASLKLFAEFNNLESRHTTPYRLSFSGRNFPVRLTYVNQWKRNCNLTARASESDAGAGGAESEQNTTSFYERNQMYALMKQQMELAALSENYEEAARLRDSLKLFEEEEPVLRLQGLMKEAIANERFEDAAQYHKQIKEIAPHYLLKCSSDATTLGIRVQAKSVYIEGRSQPLRGQYFFAYRIRITNNSNRPVQLLKRHWIVTNANEKSEDVWGIGVIGEQPVLLPNDSFEYSSACPLTTPSGRMEGEYEMKHIDKVGSKTFNVAVAPFALSSLGDVTDNI